MRRGQTSRLPLALIVRLTLLIVTFSTPTWAFYEMYSEAGSVDLRGMVRGFGTAYQNPDNDFFYEERSDAGVAGIARLIMQSKAGQRLSFDVNAYRLTFPLHWYRVRPVWELHWI